MALHVKDGGSTDKYLLAAGVGSIGDPYVPIHMPFDQAITEGLLPGYTSYDKFGAVPDIDVGEGPFAVWPIKSLYTGFLDAAEVFQVVSDSADDALAGIGAQRVEVSKLLDVNYDQVAAIEVDMAATTNVDVNATPHIRGVRVSVIQSGSSGTNVGTISLVGKTSGKVLATIPPGESHTQIACDTVPNGKILRITDGFVRMARASGAAGSLDVAFMVRVSGGSFQKKYPMPITDAEGINISDVGILELPAKTDFYVWVDNASDNNTKVSAILIGHLEDA